MLDIHINWRTGPVSRALGVGLLVGFVAGMASVITIGGTGGSAIAAILVIVAGTVAYFRQTAGNQ